MRRSQAGLVVSVFVVFLAASCGQSVRRSGQIETFDVVQNAGAKTGGIGYPRYRFNAPEVTLEQARVGEDARLDPMLGDLVRFTNDSVTITVPQVYLNHLPSTLSSTFTKRYDAMLFAEVWENAASDRSSPSLNKVVYVALDQNVPGMLNFTNAIAYGPTTFKGHPIRIKFTLVLLQRRAKESTDTAAKTVQDVVSVAAAANPVAGVSSTVIGLLRQLIKSLPDVEAFDFEATFIPFRPPEAMQAASAVAAQTSVASKVNEVASSKQFSRDENIALAAAIEQAMSAALTSRFESVASRIDAVAKVPLSDDALRALVVDKDFKMVAAAAKIENASVNVEERINEIIKTVSPEAQKNQAANLNTVVSSAKAATVNEWLANSFTNVQRGVQELREATNKEAAHAAIIKIQSCSDYRSIVAADPAVELLKNEINSRPWLRYGMYAIVETARYPADGSEPRLIDVDGKLWEKSRLTLGPGDATNYMLMDVLPGQIAVDDRVLQAASAAATELFDSVGYVPTRQILDAPERISQQIDRSRLDILESIIRIKSESLAMSMARNAKDVSKKGLFEPKGEFEKRWEAEVFSTLPKEDQKDLATRWTPIRDSVRTQFSNRFSVGH